jgi:hypothetical protein
MKKIFCLILVLIFISVALAFADTDEQLAEDKRRQEDEQTKELEKTTAVKPVEEKFTVKFGGWLSSTFRKYKNIDNDSADTDNLKSSWENDLRYWLWMNYLKKYSIYLRLRNTYTSRTTGSGYTGIGDDNEGPYLDMGYFAGDFSVGKTNFGAKLGRQFFSIGRGISFSGVHDGIELAFRPKDFYLKGLFAHSNPKDDNIDLSVPQYDKKEDRLYLGLEASYTRLYPLILYIYGLTQRDLQEDYPYDLVQRYQYHSHYLGVGLDRQQKKGLSYWAELIKEWGRDFMDTYYVNPQRCKIDSWAADLGTRYIFETRTHPSLELEYAYGSGDPDRTDVTYTRLGGNQFGEDNNFSYYGYFSTGYALAARLSNLELVKIQAGFTPFENIKYAQDIDVGVKYFYYRKDRAEGPIYDTEASQSSNDVGQEINAFLYWQPRDNFYLNLRFGVFYPGDAFPDATNSNTKYFLCRATLTF